MLSQSIDIDPTHDLGTYMGTPMVHHIISHNSFTFILNNMHMKLSMWKTNNNLSFVGKVNLE